MVFNMTKLIVGRIMACWYCLMAVLLVGTAVLGTGCGARNEIGESLAAHQSRWSDQGKDSYRYELRIGCFCPPEVTDAVLVFVRDGITDSVLYIESGRSAESRYFEKYDTIDKVFLVIQDAIDREADKLEVTYDEDLGIPTRIYIDFIEQAADDEISYEITRFQILE
jgi:hypothetical protein